MPPDRRRHRRSTTKRDTQWPRAGDRVCRLSIGVRRRSLDERMCHACCVLYCGAKVGQEPARTAVRSCSRAKSCSSCAQLLVAAGRRLCECRQLRAGGAWQAAARRAARSVPPAHPRHLASLPYPTVSTLPVLAHIPQRDVTPRCRSDMTPAQCFLDARRPMDLLRAWEALGTCAVLQTSQASAGCRLFPRSWRSAFGRRRYFSCAVPISCVRRTRSRLTTDD